MDVRIRTLEPIHVARVRHVGPYTSVEPCFERLFRWAAVIGVPTGRVLTVSYDEAETNSPDWSRLDACVEVHTRDEPPPEIELGSVGGGRYAVYRYTGPYGGIARAYGRLIEEWLPDSGESIADRPRMELHLNSPVDICVNRLVMDLCLPLQEGQDSRRQRAGCTGGKREESGKLLEDAIVRIEAAAGKHYEFLREAERFVYQYDKGMIRGFEDEGDFAIQFRKPTDSYMTGRGRLLAGRIIEDVRSALDYVIYALSIRNDPEANPKYPKFVIADDWKSFEAQAKGALKHLTDVERAFVEGLQPYSMNNEMLSLIRDVANRVKHRNLLKMRDSSGLEIVFGDMAKKEEYEGWWCYPQDKGAAVFARGELQVIMLGNYDAVELLRAMITTGSRVVEACDRYLATGAFPKVMAGAKD